MILTSLQPSILQSGLRPPSATSLNTWPAAPPEVRFVIAQVASFFALKSPTSRILIKSARSEVSIGRWKRCSFLKFLFLLKRKIKGIILLWNYLGFKPSPMTIWIWSLVPAVMFDNVQAASFTMFGLWWRKSWGKGLSRPDCSITWKELKKNQEKRKRKLLTFHHFTSVWSSVPVTILPTVRKTGVSKMTSGTLQSMSSNLGTNPLLVLF